MSLKKGRCMERKVKCRKKVDVGNIVLVEDSRKIHQKEAALSVLPSLSPSKVRAGG